jgi:hypothetical protein
MFAIKNFASFATIAPLLRSPRALRPHFYTGSEPLDEILGMVIEWEKRLRRRGL